MQVPIAANAVSWVKYQLDKVTQAEPGRIPGAEHQCRMQKVLRKQSWGGCSQGSKPRSLKWNFLHLLTDFLNWGVQRKETLLQQLLHHLLIVCLYLRDHVAWDKANSCAGFPTVEPISILVPINLRGNIGRELGASGISVQAKGYQSIETTAVQVCNYGSLGHSDLGYKTGIVIFILFIWIVTSDI